MLIENANEKQQIRKLYKRKNFESMQNKTSFILV